MTKGRRGGKKGKENGKENKRGQEKLTGLQACGVMWRELE